MGFHQALIVELLIGVLLIGWSPPGGLPLDSVQLIILIILEAFWVYQTLGDTLNSIVPNSDFGKRFVARVMTIFSFRFLPNVTNIVFAY